MCTTLAELYSTYKLLAIGMFENPQNGSSTLCTQNDPSWNNEAWINDPQQGTSEYIEILDFFEGP